MRLERLSCKRRVALLLEYLDRELPPSRRHLIARHRAACRTCACLLRSLESTVRTLRALKSGSKAPASARRGLEAALRKASRPAARPGRRR